MLVLCIHIAEQGPTHNFVPLVGAVLVGGDDVSDAAGLVEVVYDVGEYDNVHDALYFEGKIWKSTVEQNKDIAWDWLTNDYQTEYNKTTHGYDTYKNGVLVTKENNPIPKFFDVVQQLTN